MLLLAADEDFNDDIVRGIRRRKPEVDFLCVRDVGLTGADDPTILEWAAKLGRVLFSHDVNTMTKYAYDRVVDVRRCPEYLKSLGAYRSERRSRKSC